MCACVCVCVCVCVVSWLLPCRVRGKLDKLLCSACVNISRISLAGLCGEFCFELLFIGTVVCVAKVVSCVLCGVGEGLILYNWMALLC